MNSRFANLLLQVLQNKFLKSGSTFIVFWFWRLFNGVSLINTAYLAIVVDKIWVSPWYIGMLLKIMMSPLKYDSR